jgi:adenosylcobinamide-GDP ribazoletransferase
MKALQSFLAAIVIFTRIPIRWPLPAAAFSRASLHLPILGWLLGGMQWLILLAASRWVADDIALFLALLLPCVLSFGMHEDGLADFADGMLGGQTAERRLEIMKDPRVGTYGVLALIIVCGGSFIALRGTDKLWQGQALLLSTVFSRSLCIPLLGTLPYLNHAGSRSHGYIPQSFQGWRVLVPLWPLLPALWLLPRPLLGLAFVVLFILLFLMMRSYLLRKLNGMTGDCLGAAIKIAEISFLLLASVLWPLPRS